MSKFEVGNKVWCPDHPEVNGKITEITEIRSSGKPLATIVDSNMCRRYAYLTDVVLVNNEDTQEESSAVDKPSHYQILPGIEVRDICNTLADQLGDKGFKGSFIGEYMQVMQYLMRFHKKNGLEDIKKAQYLLNKLVDNYTEFP